MVGKKAARRFRLSPGAVKYGARRYFIEYHAVDQAGLPTNPANAAEQ
jgi:hypothetical protein